MRRRPSWLSGLLVAGAAGALVVAGASTAPASAAPARATWIVMLRSGDPGAMAAESAQRSGGSVGFVYRHAVRGFSYSASAADAAALRHDPRVASVVRAGSLGVTATTQPSPGWALDRVDQRTLPLDSSYTYDGTGAGVTVFVLDTGIRFTHQDFGGRASAAYDSIADGTAVNDCNGHGTHVAGIIGGTTYGVAKGVSLRSVRVLKCDGTDNDAQLIAGIDYVTAQKQPNPAVPMVANLSLGGAIDPTIVNAAVRSSIAAGVTYVIAAGNGSKDECATYSPANVGEAITVGATTKTDAQAFYSSYGPCLDLYAPGGDGLFTGVVSDSNASDSATTTKSGTSMAAPFVTGAVAIYLAANPTATPAQVASWVVGNATPGVIGSLGTGSPNRLLDSRLVVPPPPTPITTSASITGAASKSGTRSWTATATSKVVDASTGAAVSGATVTVTLSSGATGTKTCTTSSTGTCSVTVSPSTKVASVTFTVTGVAKSSTTWNGVRASVLVARP